MECPLCIEPTTNPIICCGCGYSTCTPCTQKYLLSQQIGAHCMNPECKIKWTAKFLLTLFATTWVNVTYRAHLKKISLERERAKLPETLAQVPRYKKEQKKKELLEELGVLLQVSKEKTRRIQRQIADVTDNEVQSAEKKAIPNFICPCPTEGCKGLIDPKFFCNLCETTVCRRCRVRLNREEKHECDEEVIKTIKLLRSDTKACPNCATLIYKISGCDQMWCTQCRTAFSWKTGQKVGGVIHNPHAVRWQRENGALLRDNEDVPCGGLIGLYHLSMLPRKEYNSLYKIHRRIAELSSEWGGLLNLNTPYRDYEDLRKQLVMDEITEAAFKQKIFDRDRRNARKEENHRILETLQTLGIERFRDLARKCRAIRDSSVSSEYAAHAGLSPGELVIQRYQKVVQDFKAEMQNIRKFINDAFLEELPPLGTPRPYIIPRNWDVITYRTKNPKPIKKKN